MRKGDIVIVENPDSKSRRLVRSYGIVHEVKKTDVVIIEMADGSMLKRQPNSVAVYIQPPPNWEELYQQQIVVAEPKKHMVFRNLDSRQNSH